MGFPGDLMAILDIPCKLEAKGGICRWQEEEVRWRVEKGGEVGDRNMIYFLVQLDRPV